MSSSDNKGTNTGSGSGSGSGSKKNTPIQKKKSFTEGAKTIVKKVSQKFRGDKKSGSSSDAQEPLQTSSSMIVGGSGTAQSAAAANEEFRKKQAEYNALVEEFSKGPQQIVETAELNAKLAERDAGATKVTSSRPPETQTTGVSSLVFLLMCIV